MRVLSNILCFTYIVVAFEPPINSLSNVKCNIQDLSMFVVNSFEVHSSIRDEESGQWFYPIVTDEQLPNSVTNLVTRTCQEMRSLYNALQDLANHRDVCSEVHKTFFVVDCFLNCFSTFSIFDKQCLCLFYADGAGAKECSV